MFDLWQWPDVALLPGIIGLFFLFEAVAAVSTSVGTSEGGSLPLPIVGLVLLSPGCVAFIRPTLSALGHITRSVRRGSTRNFPKGVVGPNMSVRYLNAAVWANREVIALGGFVAAVLLLYLLSLQYLTPNGLVPLLCLVSLWHRLDRRCVPWAGQWGGWAPQERSGSSHVAVSFGRCVSASLCVLVTLCFGLVAFSDQSADVFDRLTGVLLASIAIVASHLLHWLVTVHNTKTGASGSLLPSVTNDANTKVVSPKKVVTFQVLSSSAAGWMLVATIVVIVFRGFVLDVSGVALDARADSSVPESAVSAVRSDFNVTVPEASRNLVNKPSSGHSHRLHRFDGTPLKFTVRTIVFALIAVFLLGPGSALLVGAAVSMFGAGEGGAGSTLVLVLSPSGRCIAAAAICLLCTWSNVLCSMQLSDARALTSLGSMLVVTAFSTLPSRSGALADSDAELEEGVNREASFRIGKRGKDAGLGAFLAAILSRPFAIRSVLFLSESDQRALLALTSGEGSITAKSTSRWGAGARLGEAAGADRGGLGDDEAPRRGALAAILRDPKQRRLSIFLCLTLSFMFVELFAGLRYNSLGLVSDAFHMLLDSSSIAIGLLSAHIATWPRNRTFPLGYGLFQLLSGFTNGVLLVFIALYVLCEAAERILDPPDVEAENLFGVSFVGLVINIIGVVFFHDSHGGHGHSHGAGGSCPMAAAKESSSACGHSHASSGSDHNMRGVYLHILADLFGSIAVMFSSLVITYTGWNWVDPFCSGILSIVILVSAGPLLASTMSILLHQLPSRVSGGREEFFSLLSGAGDSFLEVAHPSAIGESALVVGGSARRSLFAKGEVIEITHLTAWSLATSPHDVNVISIQVVVSRTRCAPLGDGEARFNEQRMRDRILDAANLTIATPRDIVAIGIIAQ